MGEATGELAPRVVADRLVPGLPPVGLVSVLIPCCGQLEYTKLCMHSLLRHSRVPFELIFLDIGSMDGSADYLAGIQAAAEIRVELVRTQTDLGINQAVEQVLSLCQGEHLVLLNNDTVVTEGWLEHLVALANSSSSIGLVGPMSNYAPPPQFVESVSYRVRRKSDVGRRSFDMPTENLVDIDGLDQFAHSLREQNLGKWVKAQRLAGFCVLVKREVLAKLGHVQGAFGLGPFDVSRLSDKAREAGYTLACCRDVFIHHFATRDY